MSLQVQIENPTLFHRDVTSRSGEPIKIPYQKAILHGCGRFPQEFELSVPRGRAPYDVGTYDVSTPLFVNRFGGLDASRDLGLIPVKASKAA